MNFGINEYILSVDKQSFRVYAQNKKLARETFLNVCNLYSETDNDKYRKYWVNLGDLIKSSHYTIIKNEDFIGVREIF